MRHSVVLSVSLVIIWSIHVQCSVIIIPTNTSEIHRSNRTTTAGNSNSIAEIETKDLQEARKGGGGGGGGKGKNKGMMSRILPMMLIPFMISTGLIPMMLIKLKFMLLQSLFIGKIAIFLMILNMLRRRPDSGGVFTHNVHDKASQIPMAHYGYNGDDEYGAYVNRRKRR